jgi:hypothetical protein
LLFFSSTRHRAPMRFSTSANAVMVGSVTAGNRAVWELGQVKLYDGGSG